MAKLREAMGKRKRPRLVPVSEEMQRMAVLLGEELLRWPKVTTRPMFGLKAFYRDDVVFALLPEKRAMEKPNVIAYKLPEPTHKRPGESWELLELEPDERKAIAQALAVLEKAYRAAGKRRAGSKQLNPGKP